MRGKRCDGEAERQKWSRGHAVGTGSLCDVVEVLEEKKLLCTGWARVEARVRACDGVFQRKEGWCGGVVGEA